jgi:tetratricopeptide (TPR) repeat protein
MRFDLLAFALLVGFWSASAFAQEHSEIRCMRRHIDACSCAIEHYGEIEPGKWTTLRDLYVWRGDLYRDKKDYDRAIADYSEALRLAPNDPKTHLSRAWVYHAKKDYDHVIADATVAINNADVTPLLSLWDDLARPLRAYAYKLKGDRIGAEADFKLLTGIYKDVSFDCWFKASLENEGRCKLRRHRSE